MDLPAIAVLSTQITSIGDVCTPEIVASGRMEERGGCGRRSLLPPWRTLLSAVSMAANSLIIGLILGYTSPALPSLRTDDAGRGFPPPVAEEESWIASVVTLSALVGGLCGGPLADRFGRRNAAIFLLLPVSLGWLLVVVASNLWCLYAGRLLTGWGAGMAQLVFPVYVAEVAPASHRGMLLSLHALSLNAGSLLANVVGAFLSWRWLAAFNIGVCVLVLPGLAFIPESPRWLLLKGRRQEALNSLVTLRGVKSSTEELQAEVTAIEVSVASSCLSGRARLADFGQRQLYRPLLLILGISWLQIFAGLDVIWFHTVSIFLAASGDTESHIMTAFSGSIIVGAAAVFGNLLSAALMDRAGRKPMLIISGTVMATGMVGLGAYFYLLESGDTATTGRMYWVPVLSLVVYLLGLDLGWGPLPIALIGELLPNRARGVAGSVCVAWTWLGMFLVTKFYPTVVMVLNTFGAFWFFAAVSVLGILFTIFALPETKNKSLEDIEKIFQ